LRRRGGAPVRKAFFACLADLVNLLGLQWARAPCLSQIHSADLFCTSLLGELSFSYEYFLSDTPLIRSL